MEKVIKKLLNDNKVGKDLNLSINYRVKKRSIKTRYKFRIESYLMRIWNKNCRYCFIKMQ